MNCFCEPRSTESTKCVPSQALLTWIVYMDLRLVPAVVLVKPALPFSQCRSNGITATAQQDSLQVGSRCSFGPALFHMLHLFKYGRCGISPKTIGMRLALWQANRVAQISGNLKQQKCPFMSCGAPLTHLPLYKNVKPRTVPETSQLAANPSCGRFPK